jgi:streptogramin lyase
MRVVLRLLHATVAGCLVCACTCAQLPDLIFCADAGTCSADAAVPDAGAPDAGPPDAGVPDGGSPDAGAPDAGDRCPHGPPANCTPDPDSGAYTDWSCVSAALTIAAQRSACLWDGGDATFTVRRVAPPAGTAGSNRYGGAVLTQHGVFAFPYNESEILKVDFDGGVSHCGVLETGSGGWLGGVLGRDGNVYAMPFLANAGGILRIKPDTCQTSVIDAGSVGFAGAVVDGSGRIWAMPNSATETLRFDPSTGVIDAFPLSGPDGGAPLLKAAALSPDGQRVFGFKRDPSVMSQYYDSNASMPVPVGFELPNMALTVVTAVTVADGGIWAPPLTGRFVSVVDPVDAGSAGPFFLGMLPDFSLSRGALRGDGHLIVLPGLGSSLLDVDTASGTAFRFVYDDNFDAGASATNTPWIALIALPDGTLVAIPNNDPDVLFITLDRPGELDPAAALSQWLNKQ